MCNHKWLHTSCTRVCKDCGLEKRLLLLDTYNVNSAPIERGYNRRQRYKVKVDKLLGLHCGPKYDDPVWGHLAKHKVTLNTPFDIRECLRSSSTKNKHYDNVRTFSDAFCTDFRVEYCQVAVKRFLMDSFDELYAGWNRRNEESFFSYAWLLRFFLEQIDSKLIVYLKPKTCKRRNAKYLQKLNLILSRKSYGIPSCVKSKIHFLSERGGSMNHRIPQCPLWGPALRVLESSVNGRFRTEGHLLHGLLGRNSRVMDGI